VFASGNGGTSTVSYPANVRPGILAVGANQSNGQRASFSDHGTALDLVAPGVGTPTTQIGNTYSSPNGTSFASPHVAAVAGLILSINPNLTQLQVANIIESTARKIRTDLYTYSTTAGRPNGTWNNQMGYGLLDAHAAVRGALCGLSTVSVSGTIINRTVYGNTINITGLTIGQSGTVNLVACNNINVNSSITVQSGTFNVIARP